MTRNNETWVQNIFVKMYGIEAFMPEVKGSLPGKRLQEHGPETG